MKVTLATTLFLLVTLGCGGAQPSPEAPEPGSTSDTAESAEGSDNESETAGRPTPVVAISNVGAVGVDASHVRPTLDSHLGDFRACFADGDVSRARIRFVIASTGTVQSASTVDGGEVAECVVQIARRWTFAAPPGGAIGIINVTLENTAE